MKIKLHHLGIGMALVAFSTTASAINLLEAYGDAVDNDPTFLTAKATYLSSKEATPQALAALLPQVTVGYNADNFGPSTFTSASGYTISATQTFFSWNQFLALSQASYTVQAAAATFAAAEQDLMQRLCNGYFAVVQAQDILHYTGDLRDATLRQLNALKERYRLGHSTITDVDQSQGAYDTAAAQYIAAEIDLYNKVQALSTITGKHYAKVDTLREDFPLLRPVPQSEEAWTLHAAHDNLTFRAAQLSVMAALKNIKAQKGNYIPSVQGNLNYNSAIDDSQLTGLHKLTYGVNLNYTAFQGGLTMSQVRQAEAQYQSALATRRQAYYQATATAEAAYVGVLAGVDQVKSGRRAVKSNFSALKHTEEGFVAGTQTVLDVLQTQTRLFDAAKSYAADRVKYVLSIVTLENAAGSLSKSTVEHLNKWLTTRTDPLRPDNTRKDYGNSIQTMKNKYNANAQIPDRVTPQIVGPQSGLKRPLTQKQVIANLEKKLASAKQRASQDKVRLAQDVRLPQPQISTPALAETAPNKTVVALTERQEQPFARKLMQATLRKSPQPTLTAVAESAPATKQTANTKPSPSFFSHLWQRIQRPIRKAAPAKPNAIASESAHGNVQHASQPIVLPQPTKAINPPKQNTTADAKPHADKQKHLTQPAAATESARNEILPSIQTVALPQPQASMPATKTTRAATETQVHTIARSTAHRLPQPESTHNAPKHVSHKTKSHPTRSPHKKAKQHKKVHHARAHKTKSHERAHHANATKSHKKLTPRQHTTHKTASTHHHITHKKSRSHNAHRTAKQLPHPVSTKKHKTHTTALEKPAQPILHVAQAPALELPQPRNMHYHAATVEKAPVHATLLPAPR